MTSVLDPTTTRGQRPPLGPGDSGRASIQWPGDSASGVATPRLVVAAVSGRRRPQTLVALWLLAVVGGMALVVYGFGPYFQQRAQRHLLKAARAEISRAANEATGLEGVTVPTKAVAPGKPVGILEIGSVRLQQVVVEGVGPSQTRSAPGHVPGTAGLGQPGNSVIVGRRGAFGGPFSSVGDLRTGRAILVTTNQGQSVYRISSVKHVSIHDGGGGSSTIERIYGKSTDDRLTLITSADRVPWNKSSAIVVVAKMDGTAFAPTPQGARLDSDIGTQRDSGATASIVLALVIYGLTISASVLLYKRLQPRTAYLLTIGPILAMTIIAAETLSRAFPAWV